MRTDQASAVDPAPVPPLSRSPLPASASASRPTGEAYTGALKMQGSRRSQLHP